MRTNLCSAICAFALLAFSAAAAPPKLTHTEAKQRLAEAEHAPNLDGFRRFIELPNIWNEGSPGVMEAYLALGVIQANAPMKYVDFDGEAKSILPLHRLLQVTCSGGAPGLARVLLEAGADINAHDPMRDNATPLMVGSACPDMAAELLKWKPDLTAKDKYDRTALQWPFFITAGEDVVKSARLLMEAGYDSNVDRKYLLSMLDEFPDLRPDFEKENPSPKRAAAATDWKTLPPYPARSPAEATKLLTRPGDTATLDDHFWNGITHREPLRLAMALQSGADVRQLRPVINETPLVLFAGRCTAKDDVEIQVALAQQLIAAGADLTGTDSNGATALILAADHCPLGVIQAMLAAGMSPTARSSRGHTPLMNAITSGRADVVAVLLDAGVDPKKEPYNVRAYANGNKEILDLLKRRR